MSLVETRNELLSVNEQIAKLEEKRGELSKKLQESCTHEALLESEYFSIGGLGSTFPPRRMCLICGLEADGWSCGYGALRDDKKVFKKFTHSSGRDEFYKYRRLRSMEELEEFVSAKAMRIINNG